MFGIKNINDKKNYLLPLEKFHSQYGQDDFVFNILNNKQIGFYVDVGARCKVISNTFYLEQKKWDGICIEPHPDLFEKLKITGNGIYNCAVSDSKKKLKFVKFLEEFGNSGFETFRDPEKLKYYKHEIIDVETLKFKYNFKTR